MVVELPTTLHKISTRVLVTIDFWLKLGPINDERVV